MTKERFLAITEICSVFEYLEDRGELEHIKVLTHVRYTDQQIESFKIRVGRCTLTIGCP